MIKRTTSKDLLAQSIEQLAETNAVNKIRIADITENCGLSNPMFYYYYKDADDILNYIFRTDFEKALENAPEKMDYAWMLRQLGHMLHQKHDFYANVLQNTHGVNSLYNISAGVLLDYIRARIAADFENHEIPANLDMMLEFHICGIRTKTSDLLLSGANLNPDEIINGFLAALPSDLKPYLLSD